MMEYSDKFSVRRAIAYGKLFSPWIQRQMIFFPLVSLLISVLSVFLGFLTVGIPFIALLSFILAFMVYFGSMVFGMHSDRYIETLVPVKWSEKATFVCVYTLIVIPLLVTVPTQLIYWIVDNFLKEWISGNHWLELRRIGTGFYANALWNTVQYLIPASVCLFALISYSSKRILLAAVWSVVSLIGLSIVGGIVGFISAFKFGKTNIETMAESNPEEVVGALVSEMQPMFVMLGCVGVVFLMFMVWLIFRKFRERQV